MVFLDLSFPKVLFTVHKLLPCRINAEQVSSKVSTDKIWEAAVP